MKKRFIQVTAAAVAIMMVSTAAMAAEGDVNDTAGILLQGECGDNLEFTLYEDGLLIISPDGEEGADFDMYDWEDSDSAPWSYNYQSFVTAVEIEEGVESIGSYAFAMCSHIEYVNMPVTVTLIGEHAFDGTGTITRGSYQYIPTVNYSGTAQQWDDITVLLPLTNYSLCDAQSINFLGTSQEGAGYDGDEWTDSDADGDGDDAIGQNMGNIDADEADSADDAYSAGDADSADDADIADSSDSLDDGISDGTDESNASGSTSGTDTYAADGTSAAVLTSPKTGEAGTAGWVLLVGCAAACGFVGTCIKTRNGRA